MKKFVKVLSAAAMLAPATLLGVTHAQNNPVNCGASFLPAGLCNVFAGASGFTLSGILSIVFAVIIAGLVLFILFQIVKAVFEWIGKSNDDKARGAAIKSITNAVVAGIVLIIALLVVVFGSKALGIGDVPNPLYGCYTATTVLNSDGTAPKAAVGTVNQINDATPYEGAGTSLNVTKSKDSGVTDASIKQTLETKIYCKDNTTGLEYSKNGGYVVGKKVSVTTTN